MASTGPHHSRARRPSLLLAAFFALASSGCAADHTDEPIRWCTESWSAGLPVQINVRTEMGYLLVRFREERALEEVRWSADLELYSADYRTAPTLEGASAHLGITPHNHIRGTIDVADDSTIRLDQDLPNGFGYCGVSGRAPVTGPDASTP